MAGKGRETSTTASVDLTKALMHGSSGIKKKLRDIKRLLSRDNLPADVKIANERALKTLTLELNRVQNDQRVKLNAQRYHKVRFFEKKKAVRFYKKSLKTVNELESELQISEKSVTKIENADVDANADAENQSSETNVRSVKELKKLLKKEKRILEHCKIDLGYILNFPKGEKYISLYAKTETSNSKDMSRKAIEGLKKTNAKREEIKKMIADKLSKNELEFTIENEINGNINVPKSKNSMNNGTTTANVDDVEETENKENNDGEEDDFFES